VHFDFQEKPKCNDAGKCDREVTSEYF